MVCFSSYLSKLNAVHVKSRGKDGGVASQTGEDVRDYNELASSFFDGETETEIDTIVSQMPPVGHRQTPGLIHL